MGKVIAFTNEKGGVGKSTSTLEIASILTKEFNKKVVVIDFDQQINTTKMYKLSGENTIFDIFDENCRIIDAIYHQECFDLIPGDPRMSKADRIYMDTDEAELLDSVCEVLKQTYDYILIDNSPTRNICLTMSFIAADYIVIPFDASGDSMEGAVEVYKDIKKLNRTKAQLSNAKIIGLLLISYEKCDVCNKAYENIEYFSEAIGGNVVIQKIRKSVKVKESRYEMKTLYEYARHSNPILDYKKFCENIIDLMEN